MRKRLVLLVSSIRRSDIMVPTNLGLMTLVLLDSLLDLTLLVRNGLFFLVTVWWPYDKA